MNILQPWGEVYYHPVGAASCTATIPAPETELEDSHLSMLSVLMLLNMKKGSVTQRLCGERGENVFSFFAA